MIRDGKHGKRVGTLTVRLDRVVGRGTISGPERSKVNVELGLDSLGTFHASYDGKWHQAKTQAELIEKIRAAIDTAVEMVWRRYIVVKYTAESSEVDVTGLRTKSNSGYEFDLYEDRAKLAGDPNSHYDRDPKVIVGLKLDWNVVEYSDPFTQPENKTKSVRSKRTVYTVCGNEETGPVEHTGGVHEQDDDALPVGCMPWTEEREAFLRQVRDAIGKLDTRMVALFNGVGDELAKRIDRAIKHGNRLLGPGVDK